MTDSRDEAVADAIAKRIAKREHGEHYEGYESTHLEAAKDYAQAAHATLSIQLAEAQSALAEIRDHWANQYDHPRKQSEMYAGSYGIGVTDGHRACAIIARRVLDAPTAAMETPK